MKLTRPQIAALRQLAKVGPCPTSTSTDGHNIGGPCAEALVRRKLAHGSFVDGRSMYAEWRVQITDAGRAALADLDKEHP